MQKITQLVKIMLRKRKIIKLAENYPHLPRFDGLKEYKWEMLEHGIPHDEFINYLLEETKYLKSWYYRFKKNDKAFNDRLDIKRAEYFKLFIRDLVNGDYMGHSTDLPVFEHDTVIWVTTKGREIKSFWYCIELVLNKFNKTQTYIFGFTTALLGAIIGSLMPYLVKWLISIFN